MSKSSNYKMSCFDSFFKGRLNQVVRRLMMGQSNQVRRYIMTNHLHSILEYFLMTNCRHSIQDKSYYAVVHKLGFANINIKLLEFESNYSTQSNSTNWKHKLILSYKRISMTIQKSIGSNQVRRYYDRSTMNLYIIHLSTQVSCQIQYNYLE